MRRILLVAIALTGSLAAAYVVVGVGGWVAPTATMDTNHERRAIWYSPRGSRDAPAIGVLYPDMDKITTLGAYYLNGPPGYLFKPTTSQERRTAQ